MTSWTASPMGLRKFGAAVLAMVLLACTNAQADTVLYADDFSGESTTYLRNLPPDVRNGVDGASGTATWLAEQDTNFRANGYVYNLPNNSGMAVLPFVPVTDRVYTLTGTLDATWSYTNTDWIAMGFAGSYSADEAGQSFSQRGNGYGWMLVRVDRGVGQGSTVGGVLSNNAEVFDSPTGVVDCKIVLDTRETNWKVTWYANDSVLRTFTYATEGNPGINYVGFSRASNVRGYIDDFQLTSAVPEPATMCLLVATVPLLLRRRRG